jgi:zinc transporter, ZIP family
MREAFAWGLVAGLSLVVGGSIARRLPISRRMLGLIMAFGAGVLISAVAYELVHEAFETSAGDGGIAIGLPRRLDGVLPRRAPHRRPEWE